MSWNTGHLIPSRRRPIISSSVFLSPVCLLVPPQRQMWSLNQSSGSTISLFDWLLKGGRLVDSSVDAPRLLMNEEGVTQIFELPSSSIVGNGRRMSQLHPVTCIIYWESDALFFLFLGPMKHQIAFVLIYVRSTETFSASEMEENRQPCKLRFPIYIYIF